MARLSSGGLSEVAIVVLGFRHLRLFAHAHARESLARRRAHHPRGRAPIHPAPIPRLPAVHSAAFHRAAIARQWAATGIPAEYLGVHTRAQ